MERNQFLDNQASRYGGAVYLNWESLILNNTGFFRNKAQFGGALCFLNLGTTYLNLAFIP